MASRLVNHAQLTIFWTEHVNLSKMMFWEFLLPIGEPNVTVDQSNKELELVIQPKRYCNLVWVCCPPPPPPPPNRPDCPEIVTGLLILTILNWDASISKFGTLIGSINSNRTNLSHLFLIYTIPKCHILPGCTWRVRGFEVPPGHPASPCLAQRNQ